MHGTMNVKYTWLRHNWLLVVLHTSQSTGPTVLITSTRQRTRCSNWYRRTNGLNLSNVAVSTACLAIGYDIPFACDTELHISVGATMGNVQVTGRSVACESQRLLHAPSNLTSKNFTVCSTSISQWFLRLSEWKTAIISAHSINWLDLITKKRSSLCITPTNALL